MNIWITWALFFIAYIYNILDAYQTSMLISLGAYEMNPLLDYMIRNYTINSLYIIKTLLFIFLACLLQAHTTEKENKLRAIQAFYKRKAKE